MHGPKLATVSFLICFNEAPPKEVYALQKTIKNKKKMWKFNDFWSNIDQFALEIIIQSYKRCQFEEVIDHFSLVNAWSCDYFFVSLDWFISGSNWRGDFFRSVELSVPLFFYSYIMSYDTEMLNSTFCGHFASMG